MGSELSANNFKEILFCSKHSTTTSKMLKNSPIYSALENLSTPLNTDRSSHETNFPAIIISEVKTNTTLERILAKTLSERTFAFALRDHNRTAQGPFLARNPIHRCAD
ncbi:hypothetical protein NPIL_482721 [Nephila pilipes]|uniref:Uncharacterized protein n=1 Tax=Nephila pilipes TaxID=299642 RepID=A0A8X6JVP5_NEPPI|nr:hypothetical protein NPIL_482721 [Nephila pilipes]